MKFSLLLIGLVLTAACVGCNQHQATIDAIALSGTSPTSPTHNTVESVETNGSSEEVVAIDRLQREVRFKASPERIISLTPATTELLFAIGAGKQIIGATKNCNYPAETENLNRVGGGTLQSLSRETIVGLQPDLVLCKWDNHQPLMEMLSEFHIPCLAIGAENLEELYVETVMLGNVTGHAEEAATLVSQMKSRVDRLTSRIKQIPDGKRRKVFYQVWDDPLMTAGPNSFIGETLRLAGLDNIFFDATTSYPRVSDEVMVSRNPDVIITPSTHASKVSVDKILNRQGWAEIKAVQEKQVYIIDGDQISRCGPRLLDAMEEIIRVSYPDLVTAEHKEESP